MKKFLAIVAAVLMLSGCHVFLPTTGSKPEKPVVIEQSKPVEPTEPKEIIPFVEAEKTINWSASLEQLVEKMVQSSGANAGSTLLLDSVKNQTSGALNTQQLTETLTQLIRSTHRFVLVSPDELSSAKQALGLQQEDSLGTRSKAIGLARYLNTPYVLYTTVDGNRRELTLSMQLMEARSGELIWNQTSNVQGDVPMTNGMGR